MEVELRHLRCLMAIVDAGGFTGAASVLNISQPSVSRALAQLERALGTKLLRRTRREVVLTAPGELVLAKARRIVAEVDNLVHEVGQGQTTLRVGHAWAAVGARTVEFQRRWSTQHPHTVMSLVRTNSPTGGLAEGACDVAIVRTPYHRPGDTAARMDKRFDNALVGLEPRYCALAADDPLAKRRQLRLADLAERVLAFDTRSGTTTTDLWPADARPELEEVHDIDDWLAVIATGRCVGVTAEARSPSTSGAVSPSADCAALHRYRCGSCGGAAIPTRPPATWWNCLRSCTTRLRRRDRGPTALRR